MLFLRKRAKKGKKKKRKNWAKMYKIQKYFEKGQTHVCNYHMYETARVCPGYFNI